MSAFKDLSGRRFGRLVVVCPYGRTLYGKLTWLCKCDCGEFKIASGNKLSVNETRSCGCIINTIKDGIPGTIEYRLYQNAKQRAKTLNLPFSIKIKDIIIPTHCPILGIALKAGSGTIHANSPSLDRVDPVKGYVPGNVCVISYRANTMKNNMDLATLQKLIAYVKNHQAAVGAPA